MLEEYNQHVFMYACMRYKKEITTSTFSKATYGWRDLTFQPGYLLSPFKAFSLSQSIVVFDLTNTKAHESCRRRVEAMTI
jgi:hypothetical protein